MENAKKIIDRIKEEEIDPTPSWVFSLKNTLVWSGFTLTILLGAMAFSVILLAIQQTDFSIISHLSHSRLEMFLGLLPFIWLLLVVLFLGLAIVSIRNSKRGYKFSAFKMVSLSLLISVALGTLFFLAGGSGKLEKVFDINVLNYESIEERKIQVWNQPMEGLLAGKITQVNDQEFRLEDFNNQEWSVAYADAFIARIIMLEPGETIKLIGEVSGDHHFVAQEIRPWGGRGKGPGRNR